MKQISIELKENPKVEKKTLRFISFSFGLILVYLVSYDVKQQKEMIQTKFHRNDEAILMLVKDLIEQFVTNESDSNKKCSSNIKDESKVIHVKL